MNKRDKNQIKTIKITNTHIPSCETGKKLTQRKTKLRKSQKLDTQTHGSNEKIKRKREITSIYKYMFVKIFFTVNMFISIDYEVMISYVKEKKEISLH